jgi:hypothetical protein
MWVASSWSFDERGGIAAFFAEELPFSHCSIDNNSAVLSLRFGVKSFPDCFGDFVQVERSTVFHQSLSNHQAGTFHQCSVAEWAARGHCQQFSIQDVAPHVLREVCFVEQIDRVMMRFSTEGDAFESEV